MAPIIPNVSAAKSSVPLETIDLTLYDPVSIDLTEDTVLGQIPLELQGSCINLIDDNDTNTNHAPDPIPIASTVPSKPADESTFVIELESDAAVGSSSVPSKPAVESTLVIELESDAAVGSSSAVASTLVIELESDVEVEPSPPRKTKNTQHEEASSHQPMSLDPPVPETTEIIPLTKQSASPPAWKKPCEHCSKGTKPSLIQFQELPLDLSLGKSPKLEVVVPQQPMEVEPTASFVTVEALDEMLTFLKDTLDSHNNETITNENPEYIVLKPEQCANDIKRLKAEAQEVSVKLEGSTDDNDRLGAVSVCPCSDLKLIRIFL